MGKKKKKKRPSSPTSRAFDQSTAVVVNSTFDPAIERFSIVALSTCFCFSYPAKKGETALAGFEPGASFDADATGL